MDVVGHLAPSRYQEDVRPPGHRAVYGSWYCSETGQWGFSCCRATSRSAPPCAPLESEAESAMAASEDDRQRESDRRAQEVLHWKPRAEFETPEGFVVHTVRYLARSWQRWVHDGSLEAGTKTANLDVRKVLLSVPAAVEAAANVEVLCERLSLREVPKDLIRHLEEFCTSIGDQEYAQANKAYLEIVMGSRKWQLDVPYLVDGNRNGPSVVQGVAERLNKESSNPLDAAGIRDHTVLLRRLLSVAQAASPNPDPSKNCG